MDWHDYTDKESRVSTKIYDDVFVDAWKEENGQLVPLHNSELQEKARYISSNTNSNKYNITQTIAETFGVFCYYEYKCAANGKFVGEYTDEDEKVWRGKKVVFCNRAVKTENPLYIDYEKNLQSISRTCDSSEIYTKLVVDAIQSDAMTDGYITIANTDANPLKDDFILNFDYLASQGAITDYQKDYIEKYKVELHKINAEIAEQEVLISDLEIEANDADALASGYEKSISSAKEELTHYQTLRDNEVTNTPVVKDKDNAFSVTFVNSENITEAQIRLEGVAVGTIKGYKSSKYNDEAFGTVIPVSAKTPIAANDMNVYCIVDEYGYAASLYTGKGNTNLGTTSSAGYIIYLSLQYSPYNKYVDICKKLENTITQNTIKKNAAKAKATEKETELEKEITSRDALLLQKESLNNELESTLGPALREGHWTPSDYDDVGLTCEANVAVAAELPAGKAEALFFDSELFEEEEKGYYYASNEDYDNDNKTYYDFIDASSAYYDKWNGNQSELTLHLSNPSFTYVPQQTFTGRTCYIIYNMNYYVFDFTEDISTTMKLTVDNGAKITVGQKVYQGEQKDTVPSNAQNITNLFENLGKMLGELTLSHNAGFVFAYLKKKVSTITTILPVLLLNDTTINYKQYETITWKLGDNSGSFKITENTGYQICYPRITIQKKDVNYDADTLTISCGSVLEKFVDYSVLLRKGYPYFTLKPTDTNSFKNVLHSFYAITYQVSQANQMLYRDALEVAIENSQPKYSYEISISQTPDNIEYFELGQLCRISDSSLGVRAASGYISQIELVLDSPKDDSITIQNYKTKFEDLFATITASSEAMKQNKVSYDMAANSFAANGTIEGSILQDTFDQNKIELSFSNTKVNIDDTDGITLTNTEPYSNGVYGQVVMRGGGIFLSNHLDENNERIWTTGITPNGINASTITTGQLDTNLIRVFAGNNMAFQWNAEGLYAYKKNEDNEYVKDTYVRYSDKGLQFIDNGFTAVDLGWNGLAINSQQGALTLTGEDGLVIYDVVANANKNNYFVRLGKFEDSSYGLRLYKKETEDNYVETLITKNDGTLWLKDYISIGKTYEVNGNKYDSYAGISGLLNGISDDELNGGGAADSGTTSNNSSLDGGNANNNLTNAMKSVRFWAGNTFENRDVAPFRVLQDGSCYVSSLYVGGNSTIGDYTVNEFNQAMNKYDSILRSSNGLIYNAESSKQTILIATATLGGVETAVPKNFILSIQKLEKDNYETIQSVSTGVANITITVNMDEAVSYRSMLTNSKGEVIVGETISFTTVSNGAPGQSGDTPRIEVEEFTTTPTEKTPDGTAEWVDTCEEANEVWTSERPYLWKREKFSTEDDWRVSLLSRLGTDGIGIEETQSYYLLAISSQMPSYPGQNASTAWQQVKEGELIDLRPTVYKPYLWTCTAIKYTNSDTWKYETPYIMETYPVGIKQINNQYVLGSTNVAPTLGWETFAEGVALPETTQENFYLWQREELIYDEIINLESALEDGEYKYRTEYTAPHIANDYNDGVTEYQNWYLTTSTGNVNDLPMLVVGKDADGEPIDENGNWALGYKDDATQSKPYIWEIERKYLTRSGWLQGNPHLKTALGQNGQSVGAVVELYRLWNSATDAPPAPNPSSEKGWKENGAGMSNWTDQAVKPTNDDKYYYLWNCEGTYLVKDTDGKYEYTTPQYAYSYDDKVLSRTEYYKISDNGTDYPKFDLNSPDEGGSTYTEQGWYSTFGGEGTTTTTEKPYLWNVSLYKYIADNGANPVLKEWQVIGTHGKDGKTVYTWIKYADDANGSNMTNEPKGKKYIGIALNKDTETESNNASDYTWSRLTGESVSQIFEYYCYHGSKTEAPSYKYGEDDFNNKITGGIISDSPLEPLNEIGKQYTWNKEVTITDGDVPQIFETNWAIDREYGDGRLHQQELYHIGNNKPSTPAGITGQTIDAIIAGAQEKEAGIWYNTSQDAMSALGLNSVKGQNLWNTKRIIKNDLSLVYETPQLISYLGTDGKDGKDGENAKYLWIKFSKYPKGRDEDGNPQMEDNLEGMNYIGMAANKDIPDESNDPDVYSWQKIVGADGKDGTDGTDHYTWTVYSPDKGTVYDDPNKSSIPCDYIGFLYNQDISLTEQIEKEKKEGTAKWEDASLYVWYYARGPKGDKGDTGPQGPQGPAGSAGKDGANGSDAISYEILPSATAYTYGIDLSYSPNSFTFDIQKIVGTTITTLSDWGNLKIKIINNATGIIDEYTKNTALSLTSNSWNKGFLVKLCEGDTLLRTLSIPAQPDSRVSELAEIDGDVVYAAEGKVRAKSIAGFSITAAQLSAGAIQTGGISSNSSLYLYTNTSEETKIKDFTTWEDEDENSSSSDKVNDYLAYVAEMTEEGYRNSTGGKMALTSNGVEIQAEETIFQLDAGGIKASAADFKSITMDGAPIFGGANVIISYTEPATLSVSSGKTIWIQPSSTDETGETTVTSISMNLNGGVQNGSNLTKSGSNLSLSASSTESQYPFAIANADVLGNENVQVRYKLSSLCFWNNSQNIYLSQNTIGTITIILSYDEDRTDIIYSGTTKIVRNEWDNGIANIPPQNYGYTEEITWEGNNIFTQENKTNNKKIYLYYKTDDFSKASDGSYVWLRKGLTTYTLTGTVIDASEVSIQSDENTIDWKTCKVYYAEK